MFTIMARHNTEEGLSTDIVFQTEDLVLAMQIMVSVRDYGYEFREAESGVDLYKYPENMVFRKEDLKDEAQQPLLASLKPDATGGWGVAFLATQYYDVCEAFEYAKSYKHNVHV